MRAVWKDTVLAESNDTVIVEGNHYFPKASPKSQYFRNSDHQTRPEFKGSPAISTGWWATR